MIIKILLYLSAFLICIQFSSFTNKKSIAEEEPYITGRFINKTFLEKIPGTLPGTIPVYCYEMNFTGTDSVNIFYGFEEATIAYRKEDNNFLLLKAYQGKNMIFTLNHDSTITLIDSVWTGIPSNSEFIKVDEKGLSKWSFDYYLNQKMIAGNYFLYNQNERRTEQKVTFMANGQVAGLKNFVRYSICYSGDCVEETEPVSNIITFEGTDNAAQTYSFKIDKKNQTLSIYKLGEPIKDIKGSRAIEEMIFDLRQ